MSEELVSEQYAVTVLNKWLRSRWPNPFADLENARDAKAAGVNVEAKIYGEMLVTVYKCAYYKRRVSDLCHDILKYATGDVVIHHTGPKAKEEWFKGWGTSGYRNNDTVNAMLAYWYVHRDEFNTQDSGYWMFQEQFINKFSPWYKSILHDYDVDECIAKMKIVAPYLFDWVSDYYMGNCTAEEVVSDKMCDTDYVRKWTCNLFGMNWEDEVNFHSADYKIKRLKIVLEELQKEGNN